MITVKKIETENKRIQILKSELGYYVVSASLKIKLKKALRKTQWKIKASANYSTLKDATDKYNEYREIWEI